MGCGQSKIENEEAVSRCKDRKLYMKEAVSFRNAFAAAHSSYTTSLKNTGAALSDYAHGEVINHYPSSVSVSQSALPSSSSPSSAAVAVSLDNLNLHPPPPPPPPPPLPTVNGLPSPLQRAATMPELKIPKPEPPVAVAATIMEEEEGDESDGEDPRTRLKRRTGSSNKNASVMEDEGAPPPVTRVPQQEVPMPPQHHDTTYDYFFSVDTMPGTALSDPPPVEEMDVRNEKTERNAFKEKPKRVEDDGGGGAEGRGIEKVELAAPATGKTLKKVKQGSGGAEGKRVGKNLLHIFLELDDHFLKASESAHEVSKMLEATRLHYHSNFADNRGHIDHSTRVMRVITWNRSFKANHDNDDGKDDFDSEEQETHATVLDKLLAWEKKLYDEVKAGELMKFEYQKKVASLNRQKNRGTNSEALEKAKAAVSHLHTRYIVDMQSLDSTVLEINRLRDEQLYPKLVQLVDGMAIMWETMRYHHDSQSKIVIALRYVDITQSPKETSEHHHERTFQLWLVAQDWHTQFQKLLTHQKEYVKALNNWLKLNLIPIESSLKEKVSSPPRIQSPPIQGLLHSWHHHLDKLPDEFARTAILNFSGVINTIWQQQEEELKLKQKYEDTQKELERKRRQFQDWYEKYMKRMAQDESNEVGTEDNTQKDLLGEKQFMVESLEKKLENDEEEYHRQCNQVREKSLATLKIHLPEVFRAISDFADACSKMYRNLSPISKPHNSSQSSS